MSACLIPNFNEDFKFAAERVDDFSQRRNLQIGLFFQFRGSAKTAKALTPGPSPKRRGAFLSEHLRNDKKVLAPILLIFRCLNCVKQAISFYKG